MNEHTITPAQPNEGFVAAIQIDATPREIQGLAASLQALIGPTMAEPGVKLFLPHVSKKTGVFLCIRALPE